MKSQINQLRAGVVLSYVNLAMSSLIPMLYTPIMLRILGPSEHGLYTLANSVVGYLGLLGFGFGTTIIRYVSKYRAENDLESIRRTYGFFLVLYSGIATLVAIIGGALSFFSPYFFAESLSMGETKMMQILLPILAVHTAITFPLSVINSIIIAYERYFYRRVLDILATLIAPVFSLSALYLGHGSIGLAVAGFLFQVIMCVPNVIFCTHVLKIRPSFGRLPEGIVKEMVGFSGFVFLASIVDMLFWATDKVIIGALMGSVFVSVYQIGGTFNNMVMSLSTSISGVLVPKITGMVVTQSDRSEWTSLFIRVGRIQFLIIGLIVSGFSVFGQAFIHIWAGPEYAESFWIAVLTMFPLCIPLIQNTGLSFVVAQNKHKFRSIVYLVIAMLNVISTYLVVPSMGIIGAALCSCIAYLLGQGLIMNIYYYKVTGLDIPLFWRNILKMAIIPALMLVVGSIFNRFIVINNWFIFFIGVALYTAIYAVLMYRFVMNDYEKDIIRKPLQKVARILKRA